MMEVHCISTAHIKLGYCFWLLRKIIFGHESGIPQVNPAEQLGVDVIMRTPAPLEGNVTPKTVVGCEGSETTRDQGLGSDRYAHR